MPLLNVVDMAGKWRLKKRNVSRPRAWEYGQDYENLQRKLPTARMQLQELTYYSRTIWSCGKVNRSTIICSWLLYRYVISNYWIRYLIWYRSGVCRMRSTVPCLQTISVPDIYIQGSEHTVHRTSGSRIRYMLDRLRQSQRIDRIQLILGKAEFSFLFRKMILFLLNVQIYNRSTFDSDPAKVPHLPGSRICNQGLQYTYTKNLNQILHYHFEDDFRYLLLPRQIDLQPYRWTHVSWDFSGWKKAVDCRIPCAEIWSFDSSQ